MKNNDLDPTPQEWEELKKNLPKFIKEGIQFAIIMGILLMFVAFVIIQIIKLLHIILQKTLIKLAQLKNYLYYCKEFKLNKYDTH